MKLPRGVSGDRLIHVLTGLGYTVIRQKGSHVRLRHEGPPAHTITVPRHNPLKTGTLHGILRLRWRDRSPSSHSPDCSESEIIFGTSKARWGKVNAEAARKSLKIDRLDLR